MRERINMNNNIARYVSKLKEQGESITEIIQAIGIGKSSFYDIMGGNQVPKLDTANKIAIALNVDIKELFPDLKEE
jgi:transcriptional regulator with XRE-family HTH domain